MATVFKLESARNFNGVDKEPMGSGKGFLTLNKEPMGSGKKYSWIVGDSEFGRKKRQYVWKGPPTNSGGDISSFFRRAQIEEHADINQINLRAGKGY